MFQVFAICYQYSTSFYLTALSVSIFICCAEALLQSLQLPETENKVFSLTSTEGQGPGTDKDKWKALFQAT